jgi:hypothetical protein
MSCQQTDVIECDTVQIIEPKDDLLVDSAGTTNDMDERGEVELAPGQRNVIVLFEVPKLNANYAFEYLYVDAEGNVEPGAIQVVPTVRAVEGFAVVLAGTPFTLPPGPYVPYVLHWRVVVHRSSSLILIDAPEDLNLVMPRTNTMSITFHQPRSGTNYGFSELRVENLHELHQDQSPIHVQVYRKTTSGFFVAVSPTPPSDFYFLRVRTP